MAVIKHLSNGEAHYHFTYLLIAHHDDRFADGFDVAGKSIKGGICRLQQICGNHLPLTDDRSNVRHTIIGIPDEVVDFA